eukprot:tig00000615_g2532.t1
MSPSAFLRWILAAGLCAAFLLAPALASSAHPPPGPGLVMAVGVTRGPGPRDAGELKRLSFEIFDSGRARSNAASPMSSKLVHLHLYVSSPGDQAAGAPARGPGAVSLRHEFSDEEANLMGSARGSADLDDPSETYRLREKRFRSQAGEFSRRVAWRSGLFTAAIAAVNALEARPAPAPAPPPARALICGASEPGRGPAAAAGEA